MNHPCLYRWAGAALVGLWCVLAQAQAPWPSKNIRIVVPYAAGGPADLVARELAQVLTADLKQSVTVENMGGAMGVPALGAVARAEPDGHTFFLASNTPMMQVPLLKKNPPYDPVKSFTPVSLVGRYIYVLVASPTLPAKDVNELLAYARANPGKLGYGSYAEAQREARAEVDAGVQRVVAGARVAAVAAGLEAARGRAVDPHRQGARGSAGAAVPGCRPGDHHREGQHRFHSPRGGGSVPAVTAELLPAVRR